MNKHPWLRPPPVTTLEELAGPVLDNWHFEVIEPTTCCKHGHYECERCGTTNQRDFKHHTVDGRGVIARIPTK
jgi:hypothetical protein